MPEIHLGRTLCINRIGRIEFPAVRRTQLSTKKAKISSTTHVQLLQWLHGKQQQHRQFSQGWGYGNFLQAECGSALVFTGS